jgi:hypothetical protein
MAKYGTNRYGSGFKYGEVTAISVYYNSGISAFLYDYNTVNISWNRFKEDPSDGTVGSNWYWKLTKSYVGTIDNPEDGTYVTGGVYGGSSSTFSLATTDIDYVNVGKEVTYTLWVFTGTVSSGGTGVWVNCGSSKVVSVSDTGTLARLTSWLPRVWLNNDGVSGDVVGEPESTNTLVQVLEAFALTYDMFKVEGSLLGKVSDSKYIPSPIAAQRVQDFGFNQEVSLGDSYNRSLTGLGYYIAKYRGTSQGINIYTNGLTHWSNNITVGHNVLLDYNDSSFEESVGTWTASSGTWTALKYPTSPSTPQPPSNVLYDLTNTPRKVGYGSLTTTSTTAVTIAGTVNIPIKGNTRYIFSGWVEHLNTSATVSTTITWKDKFGNTISTTTAPTATTTTTSWQEFTSISDSGRNGKLSPVSAYFATVTITVTPSAATSSQYIFDFFQLAEAYKSFEYEDARKVRVNVRGQKTNFIPNPDFEAGLHSWSGYNGTLSTDTTTAAAIVHGTNAGLLTSTVAGTCAFVSDWIAVDPNVTYTFSAYVMGSAVLNAVALIEFSSQANTSSQTTTYTDTNGAYYPTTIYSNSSSATALSTTATKQISVTAITPPYSQDTGYPLAKVSISFASASIGTKFWMDGVLLERSQSASPYFSGSGGIDPVNPVTTTYYNINNCRWETRNMFNYMSNSSLEVDTSDWAAGTGTTVTRTNNDNTYTTAFSGTYWGKAAYTTTGSITGTAYLPWAAVGGEDVAISLYVRGAATTYTIGTSSYIVGATAATGWTRISTVQTLAAGATTVAFTVSVNSGTYFHFDAAQVEYGRRTTPYVAITGTNITTIINPTNTAKTIYAIQGEATNGGKGNYLYNYNLKASRLKATLPLVAPNGSSTAIKTGLADDDYRDLTESLVPSGSFEKDLGSWTNNNSTMTRVVSRGSLFGDNVSHGQAYAKITTVNGTAAFGVTTSNIYITPNANFFASAAIRPETGSAGTYTLTTTFYDANNTQIYTTTKTATITLLTRWAYISNSYPVGSIVGSAYAKITVTCTPTAFSAGQAFDLDRVVFRQ